MLTRPEPQPGASTVRKRGRKGTLIGALLATIPALFIVVLDLTVSDGSRRSAWDLDAWDIVGLLETVGLIIGVGAVMGRFIGRTTSPVRKSPTIALIVGLGASIGRVVGRTTSLARRSK